MKKFLSVFLASVMLMSTAYTVSADEEAGLLDTEAVETELVDEFANDYVDLDPVEDEKKEEVIIEKKPFIEEDEIELSYVDVLSGLGILNSEEDLKRPINRGEFAHYLFLLSGHHTDSYYGEDMRFIDVSGSPYIKEINGVASRGHMTGYGNSTFMPEKGISTIEAMTAILRMAGYRNFADNNGGYPKGYLSCASETDLLEGVAAEDSLTYENLVRLLYNALFVPVVEIEVASASNNGIAYSVDEETNVLVHSFNVERIRGQITATNYTSMGERAFAPAGQVTITSGGKDYNFLASNVQTEEMLGCYAYFYIRDDEELLAFEPVKNEYSAVLIKRQGIVSINEALTKLEAIKEAGATVKTYKIDEDAEFVYNGKNCFEVTKEDIEQLNGNLRLADYDGDGYYDIVYIWNYVTYFVDSIIQSENIINDKKTGVFLKLDENEADIKYYKYGKLAEFSTIGANDVISVATSRETSGDTLITIHISSSSLEGTLSYIGDGEIGIDDGVYNISYDFDMDNIKIGTKALFGVNFMDEVCCYDKVYSSEKEYAYFINTFEADAEYEGRYYLKFFSQAGVIETVLIAEKFYVNNDKGDWSSFKNMMMEEGLIKKQFIAISRDSDGEVKRIYTSGEQTPVAEDTAYEKLTFNKKYTNVRIRKNSIQGDYMPGPDTVIFLVTLDRNSEVMEDSSGVYDVSTIPVPDSYRPTVYVYDAGEDLIAGAMLYEIPESSYSTMLGNVSTFSFLVDRIVTEIDENNDEITKVYGYLQGTEKNYIIDDTLDVSEWRKGDIRMLSASKKTGRIVKGRQFFGIKNETGAPPSDVLYRDTDYSIYPSKYNLYETNDNTNMEAPVYGTVKSVSYTNNYVIVELADGSGYRIGRIVSYSHWHTYSDKGGFEAVTSADIVPGKEVYMMTRYGNIMEFVMFDN